MKLLCPARPEDWEQINILRKQVHEMHVIWRPDIFRTAEIPYPMEYFLEDIRDEKIYTAKVDGVIVGYVMIHTWSTNGTGSVCSKVMDIDDIVIDKHYRHQGLGQKIMTDIMALAKERGCNDIQLSVYPQNESAIRFYERCGFQVRNIRYQMYI